MSRYDAVRHRFLRAPFLLAASVLLWTSCRDAKSPTGLSQSELDAISVKGGNGNGNGKHQRLSPRESEVMSMILEGRRLKEIAAKLDISVKTVTTHRSRLLRKLGLDDNLGLYRYGVRNGLIAV